MCHGTKMVARIVPADKPRLLPSRQALRDGTPFQEVPSQGVLIREDRNPR